MVSKNKNPIKSVYLVCLLLFANSQCTSNKNRLDFKNNPPNVFIITIDTTRADRLGCYGYPGAQTPILDELGRNAVLFKMCLAPAVLTLPAHCSIFTGLYPAVHGVRINGSVALSDKANTIAEVLNKTGYRCAAFISAFVLDGRWGLKQGFDYYNDKIIMKGGKQFDIGKVQRPADEVIDSALSWINHKKDNLPLFMWLHLYDPHTPYEPPEAYRKKFPDTQAGRYDGEIAFMDAQIGRFFQYLKKKNLFKNSLIAVVGDHGESLGEHGEYTHGYYTYQSTTRVPLILRFPNGMFAGHTVEEPVSSVDLTPTILALLNKNSDIHLNGESLLPIISEGKKRKGLILSESMTPYLLYGWAPIYAALSGKEKFIDTPDAEYFFLDSDPDELVNMFGRKPVQGGFLRKKLKMELNSLENDKIPTVSANLDQDTINKLASLGYAAMVQHTTDEQNKKKSLVDPKIKFPIYQLIESAASKISDEHYEEAITVLNELLIKEPETPQIRLLLASTYLSLKNIPLAKKNLDVVLKENPNNIQALVAMANILKTEGLLEEMIALCLKAIQIDDKNTQAYALIGDAYMGKNEYEKAFPYLKNAVDIQPKLSQNRVNLATCLIGLGKLEEAESLLTEVTLEAETFATVHYHLGLIQHKKKNYDAALTEYRKELEYHPHYLPARFNLGEVLFLKKDVAGYRKEMETIVNQEPELARGYMFLARGLLAGEPQEYKRGVDLVNHGLKIAKDKAIRILGYYLLADFYSRLNEQAKKEEMIKNAQNMKRKPL